MKRHDRPQTLLEYAIQNLRAAGRSHLSAAKLAGDVTADLWAWVYLADKDGEWPTQERYAEYWKVSTRTQHREWQRFAEAFPGEKTPERIGQVILKEIERREIRESAQGVQVLSCDTVLQAAV